MSIPSALETVRSYYDMDVAYLSEFVDGTCVMRAVSVASDATNLRVGDWRPFEEAYCRQVYEEKIPAIVLDTSKCLKARELDVTRLLPIGSHVGVPVRLENDDVYGMLCCLGHKPTDMDHLVDLSILHTISEFIAEQVGQMA
ncbi:GAF domain-containing protein [Roseicyclus sp. F158]|uniref:GAF domain-containing protein n=1 Tax=Tropicimonas omnivorans TaxID=3075590 RepID=A0ABU3DG72_9RHOB|nr:GAF domain-containing protein [Roseicyclus sp. F158]MDT0682682.1 GAF domain-containing protein [Roseicyclus sp. F158]